MKILYFTTAIDKNDYASFLKRWSSSPNPSQQNFHDKMIRSLAINNELTVFSFRPFSKRLCLDKVLNYEEKNNNGIHYIYFKVKKHRIDRYLTYRAQVNKAMKKINYEDAIIISDTINPMVITFAKKCSKKYHLPIVGVCTDSPSNISNTSRSYTLYLLDKTNNLDGYIALTKGLNDLFNPKDKPSIIIEGLVEDTKEKYKKPEGVTKPYFLYAGTLMPYYGIYNLIEAYKRLNKQDVSLYILGHHADEKRLLDTIKGYDIHYLGTLPVDKTLEFETNSLANINPRPTSEDLDRFSIPSKTIEYLYSGKPTISVKNTRLQKYFSEEIIWCKSNDIEDLLFGLNRVLELNKEERQILGSKGQEKVISLFSLSKVNKKLVPFLNLIKNSE